MTRSSPAASRSWSASATTTSATPAGPASRHDDDLHLILEAALTAHGCTVLRNRATAVYRGPDRLWLVGLDDLWFGHFDPARAFDGVPPRRARLVLSHNPDTAPYLARPYAPDLILSGHTHGGQIRLPVYGPPRLNVRDVRTTTGACSTCRPTTAGRAGSTSAAASATSSRVRVRLPAGGAGVPARHRLTLSRQTRRRRHPFRYRRAIDGSGSARRRRPPWSDHVGRAAVGVSGLHVRAPLPHANEAVGQVSRAMPRRPTGSSAVAGLSRGRQSRSPSRTGSGRP